MDKWDSVFPEGISRCLKDYFKKHYLWTPKFDPRFPNQNQTKRCFVNFVDYQRCLRLKGDDCKDCDYFKYASKVLCPTQWVEKWNEQLENGSFPVKFD
jgi:cytochrome c oxidase subunit 6b